MKQKQEESYAECTCFGKSFSIGAEERNGQAVLQELCAALTSSVRSVVGKPDFEVTTVYHVITGDYIGTNGMIHSLSGKGQPKGAR